MPRISKLAKHIETARTMYDRGDSLASIAKRDDLSVGAVRRQFIKHGIRIRTKAEQQALPSVKQANRLAHQGKRPSRRTEFKKGQVPHNRAEVSTETIISLYKSGMTGKEVGGAVGLSRTQVIRRLKSSGVDVRSSKNALAEYTATHKKENHPRWKGGVTPINIMIRQDPRYIEWRESIFSRDNYTCQVTNARGGRLEVHHFGVTMSALIKRAMQDLSVTKATRHNRDSIVDRVLAMHTPNIGITLERMVHKKVHSGLIHIPGDIKRRDRREYNKVRKGSSGTVTTIAAA